MSTSTASRVTVRLDSIAGIAAAISEQWLQVRRVFLKHKPAPDDKRVHQIRRNIACDRAQPFFLALAGSFADLDDGAPVNAVLGPYRSAIATLEEYAAARAGTAPPVPMPLLPVMRSETRAQAQLDDAQLYALEHPNSPDAWDRVEHASTLYEESLKRVRDAIRARRAQLRFGAIAIGRTVQ